MLTMGIDSGSAMTKAVLFDGQEIVDFRMEPSGSTPGRVIHRLYEELRTPDTAFVVATGYGRALLPEADKSITEITCHGAGAAFLCPSCDTVIDIGGQDSKVILLDPSGGQVKDFLMNDKCAAGTGRFLEMTMSRVGSDIASIDTFVEGAEPVTINSMCAVFAESEIIGLLAQETPPGSIALGCIYSICRRTAIFAQKLAPEHPIVASILEYRTLAKLKSTYADGLAGFIGPDGRIHSTFNQTITATGRISSTEPNLQNIPVRMELGRLIRKVFVPKPGCVFVDADYSQIELRVLAHLSRDERLIQAYRDAEDIHRITASQVFHIPFDEVTPLQRRNAKAVNFGIVYGISSFGLSQDLSISRKEASEYIEKYFETYPGIKSFLDGLVENAKKNGYVTTLYGRRRPMPELKSSNFMQRSFGERVAMNAPIQGTAADIIKIAMIHVSERLKKEQLKSRLILQVHDELLIEAEESELEQVKTILREEMQGAAELSVRLEIDMHTGKNWYEAK